MRPEDVLARLPVPLRRAAYRTAHRVLSVWWVVRRPRTEGVKCVVRHQGRVLLVRHTYGDRALWELPGGGIRRGEAPIDAAAREALEELGITARWRPLGSVELREGKVTGLHAFIAHVPTDAVVADRGEIEQVCWAAAASLPSPLSGSVTAVLALAGAGSDPLQGLLPPE